MHGDFARQMIESGAFVTPGGLDCDSRNHSFALWDGIAAVGEAAAGAIDGSACIGRRGECP